MMRTLFLQAPSFDGFDGGAGARYQKRREIKSFWYPTWLAQPAALVEGSKLIDAPPHRLSLADVLPQAKDRDLVVLHTSTPSFASDVKTVRALKAANPSLKIGLIGAKVAVEPARARCRPARRSISSRATSSTSPSRRSPKAATSAASPGCPTATRDGGIVHNDERACWTTWTSCRSSRRSTSATSTSRTTSSAICSTRTCRSTPGAAANRAAPSACGRRPSAGTATAPAASATSSRRSAICEAGLPAGQGVLLRRRHAHRRPAARRGARPRARQARRHLVLQRQGQRAARDAEVLAGQRLPAARWSATSAATSRSCTTSRRACGSTWRSSSPRTATSSASRSTAPSSWACRARPRRRSRRPSSSPPRSTRTPSRSRSRRPIPARSSTSRPGRTAGSTPTTPTWSTTTASRSRRCITRI